MIEFEKSWSIYMGNGLARTNTPTFLKSSHTSCLPAYEDGTDSVPKRRPKNSSAGELPKESIQHFCEYHVYRTVHHCDS